MIELHRWSILRIWLLALAIPFICPLAVRCGEPVIRSPVMEIAPWGMIENGAPTGIYYELQDTIARHAGFRPQLTIRPYIRIAAELDDNIGDFTLMTENPQIVAAANKVGFLTSFDVVVLSRASDPINSIDALRGKTIAILRGNAHYHLLDGKAAFTIEQVYSTRQQLSLLANGRVDAILGIRQAFLFDLKQRSPPEPLELAEPLSVGQVPAFIWLSKGSPPEWGVKLAAATEALRADGTLDAILKHYR